MRYKYEACPRCVERGRDGRGDNLVVYDDGGVHCFSCGHHRSGKYSFPSLGERIDHGNASTRPSSFTREIPARAWQWLLQYGLPHSYWEPKVGWDEAGSRLVFAIPDLGSLAFSQGRFIAEEGGRHSGEKPPPKWFTWGEAHRTPFVVGTPEEDSRCLVLVEDWISANKVGQIQPCISLFGTKVFPAVLPLIRHIGLPVVMWLDNDQRGAAARRAMWLSTVSGLPVSFVFSEKDPKSLTTSKIGEILNELSHCS